MLYFILISKKMFYEFFMNVLCKKMHRYTYMQKFENNVWGFLEPPESSHKLCSPSDPGVAVRRAGSQSGNTEGDARLGFLRGENRATRLPPCPFFLIWTKACAPQVLMWSDMRFGMVPVPYAGCLAHRRGTSGPRDPQNVKVGFVGVAPLWAGSSLRVLRRNRQAGEERLCPSLRALPTFPQCHVPLRWRPWSGVSSENPTSTSHA